MKRFPLFPLLATAAAMTLSACGPSITVKANHDPNAAFSTFKTYAWATGSRLNLVNPHPNEPAIERAVHELVDRELTKKGYTKTTPGSADFLVGYAGTTDRRIQTQTVDTYYGYQSNPRDARRYPWGGGTETEAYLKQYNEGTLVIDISTPKSKKLIWRSSAQTALLKNPSPERTSQRLDEAIRKILAGFPPK